METVEGRKCVFGVAFLERENWREEEEEEAMILVPEEEGRGGMSDGWLVGLLVD